MVWNRRDGAPFRARKLLADLDTFNVEVDAQVLDAVTTLDRIEADKPAEPDPQALHRAILDGAAPAELDAIVLRDLGSGRIRTAYEQARLSAAVTVLRSVLDDRDNIHAQLAEHAQDAITKLEQVAALDGAKLDSLIREGRHDDARLLADAEIIGVELNELHQLRDLALTPDGVDLRPYGLDVSRWRDPTPVAHAHGDTPAAIALDGLRRGGQLWYPSADEQVEALAPLVAEHERKAQQRRESQHGIGSFVGG